MVPGSLTPRVRPQSGDRGGLEEDLMVQINMVIGACAGVSSFPAQHPSLRTQGS